MFQWDDARVAALVNAQSSEGQSLEFKAELPARNDKGKAEFLKDVSALANAAGGAILFGVSDKAGAADALSGMPLSDPDAEIRRLSQILESGIEPRIAGIQFAALSIGDSNVLVVDVPQSFDAPHRYTQNNHSKFVQRVGSHVSELTYDQLRSAFNRSGERVARIREEWANDFGLKRLWRPLDEGPICVLRLSALLSADGRQVIDPQVAMNHWSDLIQSDWGGGSPIYNYEGLVAAPSRDNCLAGYTQVHRIGAVTSFRMVGTEWQGQNLFVPGRAERFIMEALPKAINFLRTVGLAGSAVVQIGVTRLSGYKLAYTDHGYDHFASGNLEEIELPELLIDDLTQDFDRHVALRPGFDLIWQSYGLSHCHHFRPDGIWEVR